MSKKNHKQHASSPNERRASGSAPSGSNMNQNIDDDDRDAENPVTEIRETMREGLNSGIETAKQAVSTAKDAVSSATQSAREAVRGATDRVETMAHDAQEALVDAGQAVYETARKNPLPLALAGLGVACAGVGITLLVLNAREEARMPKVGGARGRNGQRRQQPAGAGQQPRQVASSVASSVGSSLQRTIGNVGDEASRLAQRAQSSLGDATRSASEAIGKVVEEAKVQGRRAGSAIEETYDSNPLAVGAAVIAAGTILGLALPSTRREDEWLGEGRDQVVTKAKDLAKDAIDKVDRIIHPST